MTTGKRALIVDDSRSARVILSRMLEQHGMAVDTAESAEQALEYLHQQRPDVIFMDHLMPGMDGFQAVQVIKGDPQTASIPLMMYTSQEGELYVSQARALGAVGVLPKTVRPVDVSRVLYQLHLLPDRRLGRSALFDERAALAAAQAAQAAAAPAALADAGAGAAASAPGGPEHAEAAMTATGSWALPAAALSEMQGGLRQSMQQLVRDQLAEQRRFMLATFEAFARRMGTEIKDGIAKVPVPPAVEPVIPPPPPVPWWPVLLTALFSLVPAAILGFLYWQSLQSQAGLQRELTDARAEAATAEAKAASSLAALAQAAALPVAVGATDPRCRSRARLQPSTCRTAKRRSPTHGSTACATWRRPPRRSSSRAASWSSRSSATSAWRATRPKASPLRRPSWLRRNATWWATRSTTRCRRRSGSRWPSRTSPPRSRQRTGGAITVELVNAGRRNPVGYPEQGENSTAGEWNAIAVQNNRVEFHLVPAE